MSDLPVQATTTTTTEVTGPSQGQPAKVVTKTTTVSPLTQLGYWTAGIVGSIISGGAGALSGGMGSMIVDPKDFNIHEGLHKVLQLAAITALMPAVVSLAKYLNLHPIPDGWDGQERRSP